MTPSYVMSDDCTVKHKWISSVPSFSCYEWWLHCKLTVFAMYYSCRLAESYLPYLPFFFFLVLVLRWWSKSKKALPERVVFLMLFKNVNGVVVVPSQSYFPLEIMVLFFCFPTVECDSNQTVVKVLSVATILSQPLLMHC